MKRTYFKWMVLGMLMAALALSGAALSEAPVATETVEPSIEEQEEFVFGKDFDAANAADSNSAASNDYDDDEEVTEFDNISGNASRSYYVGDVVHMEWDDDTFPISWTSSKPKRVQVIYQNDDEATLKMKDTGSAKITIKLSNGKKHTLKIKVLKNKVDNMCRKPTKYDINELDGSCDMWLKSMERLSNGDIACTAYFLNGTSQKIKYLENIAIYAHDAINSDGDFAEQDIRKLKVNCKKHGYSTFKFTFTKDSIGDNFNPRLAAREMKIVIDFTHED